MDTVARFHIINEKYNETKLHLDEINKARDDIAKEIEVEDIKNTPLEQLHEIVSYFHYKDSKLANDIKDIFKQKEIEKYPQLGKAYHFPELNCLLDKYNIDFVKALDEVLYHENINSYLLSYSNTKHTERVFNNRTKQSNIEFKFSLTKEEWFSLFDELKKLNLVEYMYQFTNENSMQSRIVKESEYELYCKNIGDYSKDDYYYINLTDDEYENCKDVSTREEFNKLNKLLYVKLIKGGISKFEAIKS